MKIKCDYCGNFFEDTSEKCPVCDAQNANCRSNKENREPQTIDELKEWYKRRNLPPENQTRFFIGKDIKEPRAFGIYKDRDTGEFVVYKNKGNGERAIRYRGNDEAYAVNELYLKLKSEIVYQKRLLKTNKKLVAESYKDGVHKKVKKIILSISLMFGCMGLFLLFLFIPDLFFSLFTGFFATLFFVIIWSVIFNGTALEFKNLWQLGAVYSLFVVIILGFSLSHNKITYYQYEDTIYCHTRGDYYEYDYDSHDYTPVYSKDALPIELQKNPDEYEWDASKEAWSFTEFEDSKYFEDNFSSSDDSDWDSDYDWDSGNDWDSGGLDWDSDW